MNSWWKSPVLQGEDNDYGQYDYLIEEIPENSMKWNLSKYAWECDECGEYSHLLHESHYYFHTLDGWDSMDCTQCLRCYLKNRIFNIKFHIKFQTEIKIKAFKEAIDLNKTTNNKRGFIYWYKFMLKMYKKGK